MTTTLVGGASGTPDVLKDMSKVLASIVEKATNGTFTLDELKRFDKRENPFSPARISKKLRAEWEKFYRDYLGIDADLSGIMVPDDPGGFAMTLVIAQDL